jgi:hypothetical protein
MRKYCFCESGPFSESLVLRAHSRQVCKGPTLTREGSGRDGGHRTRRRRRQLRRLRPRPCRRARASAPWYCAVAEPCAPLRARFRFLLSRASTTARGGRQNMPRVRPWTGVPLRVDAPGAAEPVLVARPCLQRKQRGAEIQARIQARTQARTCSASRAKPRKAL